MSDLNQPDYYVHREHQERLMAASAVSPAIRAIHLDLAARYGALAEQASPVLAPRMAIG